MQTSSIAKQSSVSTLSSTETQNSLEEDGQHATADIFQNYGWKAMLLLQFQPQFEIIIMISIYFAYICSFIDICFAFSTELENIPLTYTATGISFIYSFDVIYMVDILSMISYKNTEWEEVQHLYERRHSLMVILDIISIVPLDAVYYSLTNANMKMIYTLRLRYMLRIFRFLYRVRVLKDTVGHNNIFIEVLEFMISCSLVLVTTSCIHYLIKCQFQTCGYQDLPLFLEALYITSAKMTSRGYAFSKFDNPLLFTLLLFTNFFSFLHISGFTVGRCLIATIHALKAKHAFTNFQEIVTKRLKRNCNDRLLVSTSKTFFNLFWKNRQGMIFDNLNLDSIIPEIMAKEISLDITWDSLKHSHLFRDREVHFLRCISPLIKTKFMMPGEVIYRRSHFKSAMVYVVTGVIQILSEQDGETPILSFSCGTCIGESTLFVDYPSTCTVICQSYCEVNILYRKDFMKVFLKYPEECAHLLQTIKDRYEEVAQFQDVTKFILGDKTEKVNLVTLKWLKTTLHDLMLKVKPTHFSKNLSNQKAKTEYDSMVFCTYYLDMLVVTEQIELVTDTVFLRETCPCILQPDSFIVTIWNTIIAVTILIFMFIYPYYASFEPNTSSWYFMYAYAMTIMYFFDIYINLSTAIKTKDGIITQIDKILLMRMESISFFVDLVASFPIELFVLFITMELNSQMLVLLQMQRLLKCYKIEFLFTDSLSNFGVITRTYLKHIVYTMIMIYYTAAALYLQLCYQNICETDSIFLNLLNKLYTGHIYEIIVTFVYLSAQQLTSLGMSIPAEGNLASSYVFILIIEFVATLFYIYFIANTSAIETLRRYDELRVQSYISDVVVVLQKLHVERELRDQIFAHFKGQLQFNKGIDILYTKQMYRDYYHPLLIKEFRYSAFGKVFKSIPLFADLPEEVLQNIVSIFQIRIFAPGEVITYSGEICKEIHIIINGFCEMTESSEEKKSKVIGPGYAMSVVEIFFEIPVVMTVTTITHCEALTASCEQFLQTIQAYPDIFLEINKAVGGLTRMLNFQMFQQKKFDIDFYFGKHDDKTSFKHFGYQLSMDTKEGVDYHTPFDQIGFFGFIRYVFLRHTIRPTGTFIRYWEISRCIFAFTTAILSPAAPINACDNCIWYYILIFLDISAWVDIYVRHHVCYFNEKGIEITHPIKTAIYYWKHGFLVDFVSVFPFELFNPDTSNKKKVFLKTLRLLQAHRILSGIWFLEEGFISPPKIWTLIKYLPIIVLTINTIGSMIINGICKFDSSIKASTKFTEGVHCSAGTWLYESEFAKPLGPIRTHLYGLFFATVIITGPGLGGFNVQNIREAIEITVLTITGFWCFIYISSKIIAANLFRNADLTLYQESMSNLVKFLAYRNIDEKLKDEIIGHFEYVWRKKRGKDLNHIIQKFNYALQEDILFEVFGKTMKESTIFSEANNSFFRSLLLQVKHEIIMNYGIICKVNDVHENMYFILKGQVEVLGPDYNRLLVLPVGSLFGNLANSPMTRQTLSMVAKGHVELLCIKSLTFHKILSKYYTLKNHYSRLTAINMDYLLGAPQQSLTQENIIVKEESVKSITSSLKKVAYICNTIKQRSGRIVWDSIILIFVCYLGSIAELYQLTVQQWSIRFLAVLYCFDILYIIDIYLNFQTGYEDEFGIFITDRKKIAMQYIKNPAGFFLQASSVIPFEIIALAFKDSKTRWMVWSYSRCNRIIRMFFVNNYLQVKNQQLNINVYFMRTVSLLVWVSLLFQGLTSLLILFSCTNPTRNISPPLSCDWENMNDSEKQTTYLRLFSVVLYIFTTSSMDDYFPNTAYLILLTMCLMIGSRFLTTMFVSEVSATLEIVLHNRVLYEENIHILREHMLRERTSPALLKRIWSYVCLLWKHQRGLQFPSLLEKAPYYLQEGVLNSMFGSHLRRHIVLRNCHTDLLRQMAARMRPRTFFPGDYITFINDTDECMYFIHEGGVDALSEDEMYTERIEKTLTEGEMFGYNQGMHGYGHEYTYRANIYSVILILDRKKWIHLLDFFPASQCIIEKEKLDSL